MTTTAPTSDQHARIAAHMHETRRRIYALPRAATAAEQCAAVKHLQAEHVRFKSSVLADREPIPAIAIAAATPPKETTVPTPTMAAIPTQMRTAAAASPPKLFATAAQLERATPLARASFYAAGGQVAAPGQPSTLPIAAAVPGLSMTQASAKLYDAAVAAAAAAVPNSEAGSLYGYALGAMMQFRAKLVDRQDMIAALIDEEAMLATYSPFPQDQAARTRLSYNLDRLREISDGLARGLPRLSALLSMPGLSEAVTVPAVPASPKPVKPLTVEQVVAANTGR